MGEGVKGKGKEKEMTPANRVALQPRGGSERGSSRGSGGRTAKHFACKAQGISYCKCGARGGEGSTPSRTGLYLCFMSGCHHEAKSAGALILHLKGLGHKGKVSLKCFKSYFHDHAGATGCPCGALFLNSTSLARHLLECKILNMLVTGMEVDGDGDEESEGKEQGGTAELGGGRGVAGKGQVSTAKSQQSTPSSSSHRESTCSRARPSMARAGAGPQAAAAKPATRTAATQPPVVQRAREAIGVTTGRSATQPMVPKASVAAKGAPVSAAAKAPPAPVVNAAVKRGGAVTGGGGKRGRPRPNAPPSSGSSAPEMPGRQDDFTPEPPGPPLRVPEKVVARVRALDPAACALGAGSDEHWQQAVDPTDLHLSKSVRANLQLVLGAIGTTAAGAVDVVMVDEGLQRLLVMVPNMFMAPLREGEPAQDHMQNEMRKRASQAPDMGSSLDEGRPSLRNKQAAQIIASRLASEESMWATAMHFCDCLEGQWRQRQQQQPQGDSDPAEQQQQSIEQEGSVVGEAMVVDEAVQEEDEEERHHASDSGHGLGRPEANAEAKMATVERLVRKGAFGKAARYLDPDNKAPVGVTLATLKGLRGYFVEGDEVTEGGDGLSGGGSVDSSNTPRLSDEAILKALATAKPHTAGGNSGWTANISKWLVEDGPVADKARKAVCAYIRACAEGKISERDRQYVYGGRVIALPKGEGKVRPIVVGEFLTRLTSRALLQARAPEIAELFKAVGQMGVAVPSGAEAIIHTLQLLVEATPESSTEMGIVQLDFANAYNTVSRRLVLQGLARNPQFAALLVYFKQHYPVGKVSGRDDGTGIPRLAVRLGNGGVDWIVSEQGVHQGDPLGPVFFSIGLSEVMRVARESMQGATGEELVWSGFYKGAFLDDVHAFGGKEALVRFVHAMEEACGATRSGLELSRSKCKAYFPRMELEQVQEAFRGFGLTVVPASEGLVCLGAPVGNDGWAAEHLANGVRKGTKGLADNIAKVPLAQMRQLLTRFCVAPKAGYMCRATAPEVSREACTLHDAIMEVLIRGFVPPDRDLGDMEGTTLRQRIGLPCDRGGLGLPWAVEGRAAAFVASVGDTAPLVLGNESVQRLMRQFHTADAAGGGGGGDPGGGGGWAALLDLPCVGRSRVMSAAAEGAKAIADRVRSTCEEVRRGKGRKGGKEVPGNHTTETLGKMLVSKGRVPATVLAMANLKGARPACRLQHFYADRWAWCRHIDLYNQLDRRGQAKLVAYSEPASYSFLFTAPFQTCLSLNNSEFGAAVQWRLDEVSLEARLSEEAGCMSTNCRKVRQDGRFLSHVDNCPVGGGVTARHDSMVYELERIAKAAGVKASVETRGFGINQGGVDIFLPGIAGQTRTLGCDVRVTNAETADAVSAGAHKVPLTAASLAVEHKIGKHKASMAKLGFENWPLVWEVQGGCHPGVTKVLKGIVATAEAKGLMGSLFPENAPWTARTPLVYIQQRLGIRLIKSRLAGHVANIGGISANNKAVLAKAAEALIEQEHKKAQAVGGVAKASQRK